MEAASGGYVEVGRIILDKGGDVNAPPVPSSRDTALTIAADKGHYKFCDLLLSCGAVVDVKNKKGNSPLWLAANGMYFGFWSSVSTREAFCSAVVGIRDTDKLFDIHAGLFLFQMFELFRFFFAFVLFIIFMYCQNKCILNA